MLKIKNIITLLILFTFIFQSNINVFALKSKENLINDINTLNTSISKNISEKETLLTQKAYELSALYDKTLTDLNINPDDVDILLKANKINVYNFRQEIADQFLKIKQWIFSDIKSWLNDLSLLKDEISIWYSEISPAQKIIFDNKIKDINNKYLIFLSGSTNTINNFYNSFSWKIQEVSLNVKKWISDNIDYISFIQNIKNKYQQIENNISSLNTLIWTIENEILLNLQNNVVLLKTNKIKYTTEIKENLVKWINQIISKNPNLKQFESKLMTYIDNLMIEWQQYLDANFLDDEELFLSLMKAKNIINSEKELRLKIYDSLWNIRFSELSQTGTLLNNVNTLWKDLENSNIALKKLVTIYWAWEIIANRSSILNTALLNASKEKYVSYQDKITNYIKSLIETESLEKKVLSQSLALLDLEEKILKWSLNDSMKYNAIDLLVNNFNLKIDNLIKKETNSIIIKKAKILKYKYAELVIRKKIEEDFNTLAFNNLQTKLNKNADNAFLKFRNKLGNDVFFNKLENALIKIDKLISKPNLSNKKQFTFLILKTIILKNLQDN